MLTTDNMYQYPKENDENVNDRYDSDADDEYIIDDDFAEI